jgi:cysteine desulfurase family protein (TIGR01976 family)
MQRRLTPTKEAMMTTTFDVNRCRAQFPAFGRRVSGKPAVFFDGPAGSQGPRRVIQAVGRYLAETNANCGGLFATSRESDALLEQAGRAMADLLGVSDPGCVVFGPNMTTLTFHLSRALSRTWEAGYEVVVTDLDHDANVTPWVMAADDAGASVKHVRFDPADCTLDLDDLRRKVSERTALVAVCCASNAVGTVTPFREVVAIAHEAGARVFLDAVHYAPHLRMAVDEWGCDFVACSAYKFFGPHVGVLWGRRELLETLPVAKLRPAPNDLPGKWMTGTQNHEGIAGAMAAVEYLADIGRQASPGATDRRACLNAAYEAIGSYERDLTAKLLASLKEVPGVKVWGITDPSRLGERVGTVSITHERYTSRELASKLAERGIFTWAGNYYALPVTTALGLEPEGMLRVGLLHYNTSEEVDRLLEALSGLA